MTRSGHVHGAVGLLRAWLAIVALGATALAGCSQARREGDMIVVAVANAATNLDPRVGTDEASQKAHQLLYSTLVRIDDQLQVVPDLATLDRPDPVTYIARLRQGVQFHNGRELTSEDVVYTFRSFLDPNFRGRSGAYRVLAAVDALDRYTVRFTLKEPFGSFPITW
jgi:peptide/nickel transport system substrate-binding protein